jgi:pentatricopeptide repeat protein
MRFIFFLLIATSVYGQSSSLSKAKSSFEEKKYSEAKKDFQIVKASNKDYAEAQYYLGRIAYTEAKYDDAVDFFEQAIDANGKVAEYHNWLGNTYGTIARDANPLKQGMIAPKMKSAWEKAIELDVKNIDARKSLVEYYTQAPGFMGGSFEKAHDVAKQLKKLNLAEGHLVEGRIFAREEKFVEAEKEFMAMVSVNPDYANGLANYYISRKQYDKAFAVYDDMQKKKPNDMLVVYLIGRLSAISGQRLERGEQYLKKYLAYQPQKTEPSHAGAHMRLGNIYEKKGKKLEARKAYEESLKLDASMKDAKEGLDRLK